MNTSAATGARDLLFSAEVALNSSGTATASVLYGPYGTVRYANGAMPTDYVFTGQRGDTTTGLDYYGARYYDPSVGQFTSADTDPAGGLNRYAYVHDDPETFTDPTGRMIACGDSCGGGGDNDPPPPPSGNPIASDIEQAISAIVHFVHHKHTAQPAAYRGGGPSLARIGRYWAARDTTPQYTQAQILAGEKAAKQEAQSIADWFNGASRVFFILAGLATLAAVVAPGIEGPLGLFMTGLFGAMAVEFGLLVQEASDLAGVFQKAADQNLSWFTHSNVTGLFSQVNGIFAANAGVGVAGLGVLLGIVKIFKSDSPIFGGAAVGFGLTDTIGNGFLTGAAYGDIATIDADVDS